MQKYQIDLKGASSLDKLSEMHLWITVLRWPDFFIHRYIGFRVLKLTKHD